MIKHVMAYGFVLVALAFGFLGIDVQPVEAQSSYCRTQAERYADRQPPPGAQALAGGVIGGIAGLVLGGVIGGNKGARRGALIGGGVGVVSGLARGSKGWHRAYRRAYNDCMAGEAPRRIRAPVWSEEWLDYCAAKYRSFNPRTGKFLAYSGEYRMCR